MACKHVSVHTRLQNLYSFDQCHTEGSETVQQAPTCQLPRQQGET